MISNFRRQPKLPLEICPVTQPLKERQAFFNDLPELKDQVFLSALRLPLWCRSEDPLKRCRSHLSDRFRFHSEEAAFYRDKR
jgi:hypothetical protein